MVGARTIPQSPPDDQYQDIDPADTTQYASLDPSQGQMRVSRNNRVIHLLRFIGVAIPMFVLNVLFQLHIFQTKREGTMADDGAVTDGLNGYERFGTSADEHSVIPFRLSQELRFLRFVKQAEPRCVFD